MYKLRAGVHQDAHLTLNEIRRPSMWGESRVSTHPVGTSKTRNTIPRPPRRQPGHHSPRSTAAGTVKYKHRTQLSIKLNQTILPLHLPALYFVKLSSLHPPTYPRGVRRIKELTYLPHAASLTLPENSPNCFGTNPTAFTVNYIYT